ncbi:MAG TPA: bifunctional DNA-formamidopyrimidine glycosylase/DNA-(apurinic or apyrimidinic site) lyase [Candidatus Paceibacterota bacterium]
MPELPEVETTVRGLRERVVGTTITDFWCNAPGMVRYMTPEKLGKEIKRAKIIGVRRRAKNILMDLNNKKSLVIHMKMTGHLLYGNYKRWNEKGARSNLPASLAKRGEQTWKAKGEGPLRDDPYNRFVHVVFTLDNGHHIAFCDMRKFGKIALHRTDTLHTSKELSSLGPELWELTSKQFIPIYRHISRGKIKQKLLDQTLLAGVGNIYSDEGLWASSIHPKSIPGKIPEDKLRNLFANLVKITKKSLATGGDSMSDYRNVDGVGGGFQNFHKAYRRTGKPCTLRGCSGTIKRIVVGARSTHYCHIHQKKYA